MPSAASSAREPVGIASTFISGLSPRRITVPLPKFFSICCNAVSSAFFLVAALRVRNIFPLFHAARPLSALLNQLYHAVCEKSNVCFFNFLRANRADDPAAVLDEAQIAVTRVGQEHTDPAYAAGSRIRSRSSRRCAAPGEILQDRAVKSNPSSPPSSAISGSCARTETSSSVISLRRHIGRIGYDQIELPPEFRRRLRTSTESAVTRADHFQVCDILPCDPQRRLQISPPVSRAPSRSGARWQRPMQPEPVQDQHTLRRGSISRSFPMASSVTAIVSSRGIRTSGVTVSSSP